ncbi:MAG TPA: TauD/TfdA family dioxygenase [bacterium]|nr:TauD/TfdA family dioxygenase [bacterium]
MPNRTSSHYDSAVGPESLQLIEGRSAWIGAELARSDEWIYPLAPAEVAELDAAMRATRERPMVEIGREQFRLPKLGPVLGEILDTLLEGRGFALIRGIPRDAYSIEEIARIYWGIGAHIGNARSQNAKGHLLGHVRDLNLSTTDPSVRIYQTTERQTFHTDSCDVVALLCLQKSKSGGLSSLTSSMSVYNEMVRRRPDLAALLFEPLATDRRGEVPEGMPPYFMLPVFNEYQGYLSVIYARRYIESAQRFPDVPRLTEAQREALDLFDSLAEDARLRLDMAFEPGDVQLVCNHVILHDRTAYEDWPEPERKRHLLRLWLATPRGRPLPPAYAQRYGSVEVGNRGGIHVPGTRLNVPLEPV